MGCARTITPILRYCDPGAAARWLCLAFGLDQHHVAAAPADAVPYIALQFGDSRVLVCPVSQTALDDLMAQPAQVGGASTQACYLTVDDLDEHHARARKSGAKIELEPQDDGTGGRFYMCRDLEGHLWTFGTRTYGAGRDIPSRRGAVVRRTAALLVVLGAAGGWLSYQRNHGGMPPTASVASASQPSAEISALRAELADERARRAAVDLTAKDAVDRLKQEQAARAEATRSLQRLQTDLTTAQRVREDSDRALAESRKVLGAAEQSAKDGAVFLALEKARTEVAQEAYDALRPRIEQFEAAVQAERGLRAKAEQDLVAIRAQLAKPREGHPIEQGQQLEPTKATVPAPQGDSATPDQKLALNRLLLAPPLAADAARTDPRLNTPCALAVRGKVPLRPNGPNTWDAASIARLCQGAENSAEPGKCFEKLMSGQVNWGGGTVWLTPNALVLCGGARSAGQTLDCFTKGIADGQDWRTTTARCRGR